MQENILFECSLCCCDLDLPIKMWWNVMFIIVFKFRGEHFRLRAIFSASCHRVAWKIIGELSLFATAPFWKTVLEPGRFLRKEIWRKLRMFDNASLTWLSEEHFVYRSSLIVRNGFIFFVENLCTITELSEIYIYALKIFTIFLWFRLSDFLSVTKFA